MSYALLFSGQGTQHPAMLPWLADDALVRATCARLGVDDWRTALADPTWAQRNDNAQMLLTGLALAAWHQLVDTVEAPAVVAGYSVGELAAFSAAGVFDADTALTLASVRAQAMDRCPPGSLLAVSGLAPSRIDALCRATGLAVAIRNGVESVILGGPRPALEQAERIAAAEGAQSTRVRINVASHTPWMREAAQSYSRSLEDTPFSAPRCVLFSNACDRVRDAPAARVALATQIDHTVRWDECMENIAARQVNCVLEVGPGHALARMWNQRYPDVPARACDDFRSAAAITAWLDSRSSP